MKKVNQKKLEFYQETIKKTIFSTHDYKCMDIITANESNINLQNLESLMQKCIHTNEIVDEEQKIENLQKINNGLCDIFKKNGTQSVYDIIEIALGSDFAKEISTSNKYKIIEKYVSPISFKVLNIPSTKNKKVVLIKNKIVEDFMIIENSENLECFDLGRTSKNFQIKVHGIKFLIKNEKENKGLIISGICKDLITICLTESYFKLKMKNIIINKPKENDFKLDLFNNFVDSLSIKDLLIYNCEDIYLRFVGTMNQINITKQKSMSHIIKDFLTCELFLQRKILIQLLINYDNPEFQYLAYLLYDLLSNDSNNSMDTHEQTILFDSLPWNVKKQFRIAMKQTIQYTNKLNTFDSSKIPLEQQICLMKANDFVKEKAMTKLKEIKAKNDDNGSKARQYLEGLLKIPFGIQKKEPMLNIIEEINKDYKELVCQSNSILKIPLPEKMISYESLKVNDVFKNITQDLLSFIIEKINNNNRQNIINFLIHANRYIKNKKLKIDKITYSGKKIYELKNDVNEVINAFKPDIIQIKEIIFNSKINIENIENYITIPKKIENLVGKYNDISNYVTNIKSILDDSVHGHTQAKRQIERIIGQWINGELDGYCFGFEGPPGVGKTSLAKKGISNCLLDENNNPRPFSFIAVGGSSNGSTFEGHNYTYVGSTWGKIVDVLMDSKCMNPIIFIDELDKISRTEHGKEITGILTHLIDSTQNNCFQDKYFNGINLDLSKALFIFSYNNPEMIDKILLDRIHRIKFKNLDIKEKLTITKEYLLPELTNKMGINNIIHFDDSVIKFIIEEYTNEAGVRQLKQIIFEILGEINLNILTKKFPHSIPYHITEDEITNVYLKNKIPVKITFKHPTPQVGIINGLWANSNGNGGIIQIETKYYASNSLLELKLTGSQGDIMKESMNVSKTLAWNLTTTSEKKKLIKIFEETKNQGLHVHCPEGSIPKDGPSAGTAITIALYSLFTNKKINNNIAITGEITLQGKVEKIGGLELKILGGIKGGITTFLYPRENQTDFKEFMEKHKDSECVKNITFHEIDTIDDAIKLAIHK